MEDYKGITWKDRIIILDLLKCSIECNNVGSNEINWPIWLNAHIKPGTVYNIHVSRPLSSRS